MGTFLVTCFNLSQQRGRAKKPGGRVQEGLRSYLKGGGDLQPLGLPLFEAHTPVF